MLKFDILETGNKEVITFQDLSEYQERPGNPMLEVQLPSISEVFKVMVRPLEINSLNSKLLGMTKKIEELPDGLYKLVYSIDPNAHRFECKKYFRLTATKCRLKSLLLQNDIDNKTVNTLYKLDIYLQAIEEIKDTDVVKAVDYFNLVQKELSKLECNV